MGSDMKQRDPRIEALGHKGEPIQCDAQEWASGLRTKIQDRAAEWLDQGQALRATMALAEVQRLDALFTKEQP